MRVSQKQLKRIIKEEKIKLIKEQSRISTRSASGFGGDMPIFHDAGLDQALNDYVEKFVEMVEDDIGESEATRLLLARMKSHLGRGLKKATTDAQHEAGIRF